MLFNARLSNVCPPLLSTGSVCTSSGAPFLIFQTRVGVTSGGPLASAQNSSVSRTLCSGFNALWSPSCLFFLNSVSFVL